MDQEKITLLRFLADASKNKQEIPSIAELSNILGISVASVREQLEVARQLGFVEVKPRTGIQKKPFSLLPLLNLGMKYGMQCEPKLIHDYAEVRRQLELGYWETACHLISEDQTDYMQFLVDVAFRKLQRKPAIIPDEEQSEFHLTIFRSLGNKVLLNLLEAYWELKVLDGTRMFIDLDDMLSRWSKRQVIVDALREKNVAKGKSALESLLADPGRPKGAEIKTRFE